MPYTIAQTESDNATALKNRRFSTLAQLTARTSKLDIMGGTSRMSALERREQLISVGQTLFAQRGYDTLSVEEIAANAKVSKPIIYEHFGGKEGLYAVIIDREITALSQIMTSALKESGKPPRQMLERAILAFLTYIEENPEGFQVLLKDSPAQDGPGSLNSLLNKITEQVAAVLTRGFKTSKLPAKNVDLYAQMIVGLAVYSAQRRMHERKLSKEQLAAHIVDFVWLGLSRISAKPKLWFEGKNPAKDDFDGEYSFFIGEDRNSSKNNSKNSSDKDGK